MIKEIVDLAIILMVIFHSFFYVYQAGYVVGIMGKFMGRIWIKYNDLTKSPGTALVALFGLSE